MKKILSLAIFLSLIAFPFRAWSRSTLAVGAFGGGNFQLVNTYPDLNPGAGGGISFEYRFNQHWGIETAFSIFDQNGTSNSQGDNGIFLLNVPDVALKFYFFSEEHRVDPYISAGLGLSVLTEGSIQNNSEGA